MSVDRARRRCRADGSHLGVETQSPPRVCAREFPMETPYPTRRPGPRLHRREVLKAGLAAGATLSAWPLCSPPLLWGAEAGSPKRGGILRVRGWDPPHFDPHLTIAPFTHWTLSFVYSRLVRHKVGADVQPGTFIVEPDLAERWEQPDDTTYVFHLR